MIDVQELPLLIEKADVVFVSPHITRRDTLVNRRGTAAAHAKMEAWFRDVWPVGLWTGPCDPAKVLFGDECPDCAVETVRVVAEKGTYRVYDFFEDRETVVEAKDGHLALPLGSKYVKLHYYAPDTPAFRAFLASVKADRPLSQEFLDLRPL